MTKAEELIERRIKEAKRLWEIAPAHGITVTQRSLDTRRYKLHEYIRALVDIEALDSGTALRYMDRIDREFRI